MVGGLSGWVWGHRGASWNHRCLWTLTHSRLIPETKETTSGVGPGPPSQGRGAWGSLQEATPLTRGHWTRPPCSARLSSWVAAERPGGLVRRAGGHRPHTFGCLVLSKSIKSGSFHATETSPSSTELTRTSRRPPWPCGRACLP